LRFEHSQNGMDTVTLGPPGWQDCALCGEGRVERF
jgi:hypothetical protein